MCSIVLDIDHAWSEGLVPQVDCSGYESMGVLGNVEDSADMRSLLIGYSGAIVWWHRSRLGRDGVIQQCGCCRIQCIFCQQ
jgi:hypothetical protein